MYTHILHTHTPKNVNTIHEAEKKNGGINFKIALFVTKILSNMYCAYFFAFLAILGFPGLNATAPQYIQWMSQTFIQLVALSILGVSQEVMGRQQQLQADEQFQTTQKTYHDMEQLVLHMHAQDEEILMIKDMVSSVIRKLS